MARPLAVEGEAGAVMADLDEPRAALDPADRRRQRRRARRPRPAQSAGRERVLGEGGVQVHQHQFLMLLLVVEAELDQVARPARSAIAAEQRRVDMPRARRGPRRATGGSSMPRRGARMALALAFVIGVEQIGPALVEGR